MSLFVVTLKAYGDFVIAYRSVQMIHPTNDGPAPPLIVAGQHVHALANVLDGGLAVRYVGGPDSRDVPPAFDMNRRGKLAGLRSLLQLRNALGLPSTGRALFDRVGWRERFLSAGATPMALPNAPNIYSAYATALTGLGYSLTRSAGASEVRGPSAVVVPASRIAKKTMPPHVLAEIERTLIPFGMRLTVLTLEGEDIALPPGMSAHVLPRSFSALSVALRAADLVISADSLAAHLADYAGVPTFVVSPQPNAYWLPVSAFEGDSWCTFETLANFSSWLARSVAHRKAAETGPGPPIRSCRYTAC